MNKKWTMREVKDCLKVAKTLMGLSNWTIKIRFVRKIELAKLEKRFKRLNILDDSATFYGFLMGTDSHSKQATIILNSKEIENRQELLDTIIHELLHIHVHRVSRLCGDAHILSRKGEEIMIERLVVLLGNLFSRLRDKQ